MNCNDIGNCNNRMFALMDLEMRRGCSFTVGTVIELDGFLTG